MCTKPSWRVYEELDFSVDYRSGDCAVIRMIYDKTRVNEPGYYDQFELCYKPALEKDRKDAESWRALVVSINAIVNGRPTEPLLVAPPVTKGKAESHTEGCKWHRTDGMSVRTCDCGYLVAFNRKAFPGQINPICDDYDLTSNDTRRGD